MEKAVHAREANDDEKSFVIYKIMRTMITSGVSPLPRNYELFYELLAGTNKALAKDVLSLPQGPDQRLLDKIGAKYKLSSFQDGNARELAAPQGDLINQFNARILNSIKQVDAAQQALRQINEPSPSLSNALNTLRKQHQEMQELIKAELDKLEGGGSEDSITPIATRDTLTGLPNRIIFIEKMTELFAEKNAVRQATLIICNMDELRSIIDRYGLVIANKALCRLGQMLKKRVKAHDFVARVNGNQFAIIIEGVTQDVGGNIADRLRQSAKKIRLAPTEVVTISIGVADNSGTYNLQDFYTRAELALVAARSAQRDSVMVYEQALAKRSRQVMMTQLAK